MKDLLKTFVKSFAVLIVLIAIIFTVAYSAGYSFNTLEAALIGLNCGLFSRLIVEAYL